MADFMRSCESRDLHSELPRHGDPSRLSVYKPCDLELHPPIAKSPKSCMKFKLDAQKPGSKLRFKQLEWADVLRRMGIQLVACRGILQTRGPNHR